MAGRPQKTWKLNYFDNDESNTANISLYGSPSEVRVSGSDTTFISVKGEGGITLAPGLGSAVNIQGLSQNFRYGGMLADLPFPLSVIPTTPFTPFPKQIFIPPLLKQLPTIRDMSILATSFVGI
jgi:hypothetical protein